MFISLEVIILCLTRYLTFSGFYILEDHRVLTKVLLKIVTVLKFVMKSIS